MTYEALDATTQQLIFDNKPNKAMSVPIDEEDDDVTDPGFTIIDGGTLDVKFHIYCNDVRELLQAQNMLSENTSLSDEASDAKKSKHNRKAVYGLMSTIVARVGLVPFRAKLHTITSSGIVAPIFAAMELQLSIIEKLSAARFAEKGVLTYDEVPLVITKGQIIGVVRDGTYIAGQVTKVEAHFSYAVGPYFSIKMQVVIATAKGYEYGETSHNVMFFPDDKQLFQLGICLLTDELFSQMVERGKKYVQITSTPNYMHYEGNVTRTSWFGERRWRATGRIVVDVKSMSVMDPDYDRYFGSEDHYRDNDTSTQIDFTSDANLAICSPYVYGFSMLAKVWGEFIVDDIATIQFRTDAFDKLVLDAKYKRVIKSLVSTSQPDNGGDLIDGKGGGLTFLLHGAPGLGKTLTAEAIAEALHRPLYSVSTGELGTDPDTLDLRLKNILDMAATWNAVLLIDEADIFLEERATGDTHRNAMVATFLKLLEYYQGILFLTTNRVKNIDQAFYSRISLGIRYPDLDKDARAQIWKNLMEHVKSLGEDVCISDLAEYDLNGRQIKHVIRQASSLAKYEQRQLTKADFDDILELSMEFREFIEENHSK